MNDSFGNTNFNQPPFAPVGSSKPKSKLIKAVFWFVLVFVILGGCVWTLNYYKERNKNEKPIVPNQPALTVPVVKSSLLANSKISFPDIEKENILAVKDISKDLSSLIADDIKSVDVKVSEAIYAGGKKGQITEFIIDKPLFDYYYKLRDLSRGKDWTMVLGSRGILATILEIENENLTVRILGSEINASSTEVYIQTIQK